MNTDPDPDAIATAVLAVPSVAALSGGLAGEVATYLPGRRVGGVQVRSGEGRAAPLVVVHVVAHYGPTIDRIAADVTAAVRAAAGRVDVHVGVDDLLVTPTA
jgi:uncharacterized alkaline shock family protein YloU